MTDPNAPNSTSYTAGTLLNDNAPLVVAMRMVYKLIMDAKADKALSSYADMDLRVLNDVQEALSHNADDPKAAQWLRQLALSWQVLRDNGNCSSSTVLLMLDRLLRSGRPRRGEWGVMMAFGPGLTLETCLLRF